MSSYQRITNTSKWLSRLCLFLLVLLPFYLAHHWLLPVEYWIDGMPLGYWPLQFERWPPPLHKQAMGIIISFLPGLFVARILWYLNKLFLLYARGIFFAPENVFLYARLASAALWFVVAWVVSSPIMGVAMTYDTASPMLTVTFTHMHAMALFSAIMLRVIAWIMSVGRELASENESFV